MSRRARRPVIARPGDHVIDGRLTARLLGLRLLDIDAHVVVAVATDAARAGPPSPAPAPVRDARSRPARPARSARPTASLDGGAPALRRAVRLLDEGSSALDDARRIRHRSGIRRGAAG
jgi:hypothetical protein